MNFICTRHLTSAVPNCLILLAADLVRHLNEKAGDPSPQGLFAWIVRFHFPECLKEERLRQEFYSY
jgi:hypothetical protein